MILDVIDLPFFQSFLVQKVVMMLSLTRLAVVCAKKL